MAHSALLAAQAALQQRRAAWRQQRQTKGLPLYTDDAGRAVAAPDPAPASLRDIPWHSLPDHLGWGSNALTTHLRSRRANPAVVPSIIEEAPGAGPPAQPSATIPSQAARATLAVAPDIALAILKAKQAAAGRLWYLLRCLDTAGRGWFALAEVRQLASDDASPYRFCGRRQLRNLLQAGAPLFWQLDADRLWLRRPARVAAALGLAQVVHRPVALSPTQLLGPLKQVKAQLYATLHSARTPNRVDRNQTPTISAHRPPND